MGKVKVFITIVVVVASIISTGYLISNKTVQIKLVDKLLIANKSPKQIREEQGKNVDKTIKIGLGGPEQIMKDKTLFFQGVEMAVDEINSQGGVFGMKLETITADDKNTLTGSLEIAQNFANNTDVSFVIGHWTSDHTIPVAQIYDEAGVLLLAPTSTNPVLTQKGYNSIFRNTVSDIILGKKMAEYAQKQGYKNIAIYYSDSMIGKELSKAFEKYAKEQGIRIIDRHSSFISKDEFDITYQKWKNQDVDGVFFADVMMDSIYLVKWLRQQDNNLPILAGDGFDYTKFVETNGKDSKNFAFITFLKNMENDKSYIEFETKFTNKFGVKPDYYAIIGYDTIKIISETLKTAKSTSPSELIKVLKSGKSFKGINGTISFDQNGELKTEEIFIKKVVDGKVLDYK